jgi:hypothetical protein
MSSESGALEDMLGVALIALNLREAESNLFNPSLVAIQRFPEESSTIPLVYW